MEHAKARQHRQRIPQRESLGWSVPAHCFLQHGAGGSDHVGVVFPSGLRRWVYSVLVGLHGRAIAHLASGDWLGDLSIPRDTRDDVGAVL